MDAIGLSVDLAGATFSSNKGYTILAGSFYTLGTNYMFSTIVRVTFDNPVQGIMGWFGTNTGTYATTQAEASEKASKCFTSNIALDPKFIAPNVVYLSSNAMQETSSTANGNLRIAYTPGTTTTISVTVYTATNQYNALCCYFYIFF